LESYWWILDNIYCWCRHTLVVRDPKFRTSEFKVKRGHIAFVAVSQLFTLKMESEIGAHHVPERTYCMEKVLPIPYNVWLY
jgi:hypothetical protein